MRIQTLCFVILTGFLCLVFSGCNNRAENVSANTTISTIAALTRDQMTEHQELHTNVLKQSSLGVSVGDQISLSSLQLNNLLVSAKESALFAETGVKEQFVYLLSDYRYGDQFLHDGYIALEQEQQIIFYDLKNRSLEDKLYLCDVNADGNNEIVVQQLVDEFGGGGQYVSRIFKVDQHRIQEIFHSESYNTGFSCEVLEDKKLKVVNSFTDYSTIIDISEQYPDDSFDATGKLKKAMGIHSDGFIEFVPKDVDEDGSFEIECLQLVFFDWHATFAGFTRSVIKFDRSTQQFKVIHAEFLETVDGYLSGG